MVFRSIILSSAREQILEATQIMSPLAILKLSFLLSWLKFLVNHMVPKFVVRCVVFRWLTYFILLFLSLLRGLFLLH